MIKKEKLIIPVVSIFSLLVIKLISAYSSSSRYIDDFVFWMEDTFGVFFSWILGYPYFDEYLFARILLFILVLVITFSVLTKSQIFGKERKGLSFVVAAIVSILAIRFIPSNEFFNSILLPYTAFGIALTVFIPFLIYFFFVHQSVPGSFGRRAAWVLFGIVFVVLFISRDTQSLGDSVWIYYIGIGFIILSLIFDRSIHKYFALSDFRNIERASAKTRQRLYLRELKDIETDLEKGIIDQADYNSEKKELKRKYKQSSF